MNIPQDGFTAFLDQQILEKLRRAPDSTEQAAPPILMVTAARLTQWLHPLHDGELRRLYRAWRKQDDAIDVPGLVRDLRRSALTYPITDDTRRAVLLCAAKVQDAFRLIIAAVETAIGAIRAGDPEQKTIVRAFLKRLGPKRAEYQALAKELVELKYRADAEARTACMVSTRRDLPMLHRDDVAILRALAKAGSTLTQEDLEQEPGQGGVGLSRKTLSARLTKLRKEGYTNRPQGERGGEGITEKGREALARPQGDAH